MEDDLKNFSKTENPLSIDDLSESINRKIPMNYTRIEKPPTLNYKNTFNDEEDNELILFELPKDFDRSLLSKVKIKNFGKNGKISNFVGSFRGINYDRNHPIPSQIFGMFTKKNKRSSIFRKMDRYVKVFEDIEIPSPNIESVIPRRLVMKKSLSLTKKNKKSSINKNK